MSTVKGIDVSTFQGVIDWNKVKKNEVQFAILRGSYGRTGKDEKFELNYKNAKAAGVPVGYYHYTYADTIEKATQEANFVIGILKGKQFEYPIWFDIEDKSIAGLSAATLTKIAKTFCDKVAAAGYYVGIYASKGWLTSKLDVKALKDYDVWVAQWNDKCTYTGAYTMWQYSDSGKIKGISGNVDKDYAYKDYPKIMKEKGLNGYKKVVKKSLSVIAQEVIDGKWGDKKTKPTRKQRLEEAGYNYDAVQKKVNELLKKQKAEEKAKAAAAKKAKKGYKKGDAVAVKDKPLYTSATSTSTLKKRTGTFYIYDGEKVNGRYRVTISKKYCGKRPVGDYVTGWMEL